MTRAALVVACLITCLGVGMLAFAVTIAIASEPGHPAPVPQHASTIPNPAKRWP